MTTIRLRKGSVVEYGGQTLKVVGLTGFDSATLQSKTGEFYDAPVSELLKEKGQQAQVVVAVDTKRLEKVEAYHRAFGPLLAKAKLTKGEVEAAGALVEIGVSAAYAALGRYRTSGEIADLPPPTRSGGRGKSRLVPKADQIIQDNIHKIILNRRNFGIDNFIKTTQRELEKLGLSVSTSTLRHRLAAIPPYRWMQARRGHNDTERALHPLKGEHPGVDAPLDQIQCDHWRTDMEILSDDRLTSIGRAWATIGIDLYSRTVWGMYIGLSAPSTTSVGLCMMNGMLRKEEMLSALGLETAMPIYGDPKRLHLDNAQEFRGESLKAATQHFGIHLSFRPVRKPQYGGHIERLNGSLARKFKELPGATGSNAAERKLFRPEMTAAFTLDDLRKHMWMLINEYHNTPHLGIGGKTPLEKWSEYYFGPNGQRHQLPALRVDNLAFRINWYPLTRRTIQRYGIRIDYLDYYSEAIEYLVKNRKKYGMIDIRRDPLDVRRIYLLHPERLEWCEVRTRHLAFPVASILDLREAKREAVAKAREPTPDFLAKLIDERRSHIEVTQKLTKTAARDAARRADEGRRRRPSTLSASKGPPGDNRPSDDGLLVKSSKTESSKSSASKGQVSRPNGEIASLLTSVTEDEIEDLLNAR